MSARGNAARSKSGGRNRAKGSSSASLPFLEAPSPIASLPPSEDSLGERALGDEENSELGDGASVASSVGFAEDAVTPASATRKKRARIDSSMSMEQTTPAAVPATEERSSTGGDQSTKIRIPYSKLRGSGVIGSPLFQSSDAVGAVATPAAVASDGSTTKLRIVYSRPGQTPERSGTMRMDFPELADFPATTRALSAVAKYGTVAKREADLLRDEMERMRNELRNFDLEVRRELDLMAETRAAPGLPDPRASPALQRRRTEDVKPTIRQQSAPAAVFVDPNKKRLKKLSSRGREEDEEESIDVTDPDAKAKAKRDQRKREKEALEAANAAGGESKKYNLKARAKDKKSKGKKGEEEDGEADSQDDAESLDAANLPSTAGGPSNPFWAFVHQFIRDFVEEDLLLLQPRQLSASDPAFLVPPLGRHWTEFRKPKSEDQEGPGEGEGEAQPIYCGDLTQRILASLIEDRLLPDDPLLALNGVIPVASTSVAPGATPSAAPAAAAPTPAPAASTPASGGAPQQFDSSAFEFAEAEAALPLSAPPVGDYSFATMLSLEERIKMELKAMGLFDPEENPVNVSQEKEEDNEIVQEIKVLQNQLREQVAKNNASRERILELAVARMADQKRDRDVRGAHAELEKAYIRVQQRRKPKRKKGGRKGS